MNRSAAFLALPLLLTAVSTPATAVTPGPSCHGKAATIEGTRGDDSIAGTPGNDVIVARGGRDNIWGNDGQDLICAGRGRDSILGGTGRDRAWGGRGNDYFQSTTWASPGPGDDNIRARWVSYRGAPRGVTVTYRDGAFDWYVVDGWGHDKILDPFTSFKGSRHDDTFRLGRVGRSVFAGPGKDVVSLTGGRHRELHGGRGDDVLRYANWYDPSRRVKIDLASHVATSWRSVRGIEIAKGSRFADVLLGSKGPNRLWGLQGDDKLRGRGGVDYLYGGPGQDKCDEVLSREYSCEHQL